MGLFCETGSKTEQRGKSCQRRRLHQDVAGPAAAGWAPPSSQALNTSAMDGICHPSTTSRATTTAGAARARMAAAGLSRAEVCSCTPLCTGHPTPSLRCQPNHTSASAVPPPVSLAAHLQRAGVRRAPNPGPAPAVVLQGRRMNCRQLRERAEEAIACAPRAGHCRCSGRAAACSPRTHSPEKTPEVSTFLKMASGSRDFATAAKKGLGIAAAATAVARVTGRGPMNGPMPGMQPPRR